jgi:ATP-binding cassette, subfamily D (ALD), peroxisomal long-chain fatty acid import protein
MGEDTTEWEFERIGTEKEKMNVERELQVLRERMSKVEAWKQRREQIEDELKTVFVDGGEDLAPPAYQTEEAKLPTDSEGDILQPAESELEKESAIIEDAMEDLTAPTTGQ